MLVVGHAFALLGAALAGAVLGGIYFGALWLSLRRVPEREPSVGRFLVGLALRMALALGGFGALIVATRADPLALLLALGGFALARILLTRALRPRPGRARRSVGGEGSTWS